jgi:hypothetical protein
MKGFITAASAALALTAVASNALAQDVSTNAYMMTAPTFNAAMYNPHFVMGAIQEDRLSKQGGGRALTLPSKLAPLTVRAVSPSASAMPAKLAAAYPAQARPQAEQVFRELLASYPKVEQQFNIPRNDLGGSVAVFLAGSYAAYRSTELPDEHIHALVTQMRKIIGSDPGFAKASSAEKQEMYEQMAILGMFMTTTTMALHQQPNPRIAANMKQAAKGYLEKFLNTDAERVQITAQGLVLN